MIKWSLYHLATPNGSSNNSLHEKREVTKHHVSPNSIHNNISEVFLPKTIKPGYNQAYRSSARKLYNMLNNEGDEI